MNADTTPRILAAADRFGADLKAVRGLLDMPRDALLRHVSTLYRTYQSLREQVASGLEIRDRLLTETQDALGELRALVGRVIEMETELRDLRARVDEIERHGDRYAGRH